AKSSLFKRAGLAFLITSGLSIVCILIAAAWTHATGVEGLFALSSSKGVPDAWRTGMWYAGLSLARYLGWKFGFSLAVFAALWLSWRTQSVTGPPFVIAVLIVACFVEPFILVRHWWRPFAKTPSSFM